VASERLSPTSYVVLGMVGLRGPSTSYDLKRAISRSIGYFWGFPHAGLYSEPQRLVAMGLLAASSERDGRRRRTYSITQEGLRELRTWLAAPTNEHFQLRDVAELKLFFNELGEPDNVQRLAREQIAQHEERIKVYEGMQRRYSAVEGVAPRLVTLRLGLEMERAALRFWTQLAQEDQSVAGDDEPEEATA
jgi:PadR family transcriptional regulator, regulatory protein AphA